MDCLKTPIIEIPSLEDPAAWEEPIPFNEIETPDISTAILPEPFRDFASALACETETAESLSVMTILGVLSIIGAKQFTVNPKEGWAEPVNIYTLIALPPANNKSLVLRKCTQPLIAWEREQAVSLEYEIKRCISERKTEEKIIEKMRKEAALLKDPLDQQDLKLKITEREAALIEPPILPQLFTNDATPEALATYAYEQRGRFGIFSDEGGILETIGGLYSNGQANIDIILKGTDGGYIRILRKDRAFNVNPYLTIVLAVQPAIIQKLSGKNAYSGNGALERFLYVIPKSKLGFRNHNSPSMPSSLQQLYDKQVISLLDCTSKMNAQQALNLTPEAFKTWREFQDQVEIELRPEGKLSSCQGWGGKISGFCLRIAGLLHIGQYSTETHTIDDDVMERAVFVSKLLVQHAIAAYGLMGCDPSLQHAKDIWRWITSKNMATFRRTEIINAFRNRSWGNSDQITKALKHLTERNIISEPLTLDTKKPTTAYMINPIIRGENILKFEP